MQYQDFENDGAFYQNYNNQKIHPHSGRTPPKPFTPQDLVKMFCIVICIFLPLTFVLGMLCGNGRLWIAAIPTCIVAVGLACIAAIMLLGFGIAQLTSKLFNLIKNKVQLSHHEHY